MEYTIEVTKEDIEKGERKDGIHCPVARAVCRVFGEPLGQIGVPTNTIEYFGTTNRELYEAGEVRLPYLVSRKIEEFDNGCSMEPFSFEVEI